MIISNLIDRARLVFSKNKDLRKALYGIFGFYPHSLEVYRIALAHKSHAYRNRKGRSFNNERLEFLGDAILEAVVSDIVYHRYDRKHEGFLTNTRSKIVQRASLNKLAKDLGIETLIQAPTHNRGHNSYIGGNAFEALMGAAYLDRGYACCKWFIEHRIIGKLLDIDGVANKEVNFKSKLLEWSQKNKMQVEFQLSDSTLDKTGSPVFHTIIVIEGITAGEGTGYSKKESQQLAAREALTKMNRDSAFVESIFDAKAKRTAMEAEEYFTVPQLDEIDTAPKVSQTTSDALQTAPKASQKVADEVQTIATTTAPTEQPASKKQHRSHARRSPIAERKEKEEKKAAAAGTQPEPKPSKRKYPIPEIDHTSVEEKPAKKEEKAAKQEAKAVKKENKANKKEEKVAKKEVVSSNKEVTSSKKETAPSKKETAPSKKEIAPSKKEAASTKKDTTVAKSEATPAKNTEKPAKRKPRPKRSQLTEEEKAALQAQREEQISAAEEAAYAEL